MASQTHATSERDRKRQIEQRAKILHHAEVAISNAQTERDGMIWLLDRGIQIDNVIYYNHTGRFEFGWRKPLSREEYSALLDALGAEFPFDYDVKQA